MLPRWIIAVYFGLAGCSAVCRAGASSDGQPVAVAAAANLTHVIEALNAEFARQEPPTTVATTVGASGNLFAQIKHGAPFDVFVSADTSYPEALARDKLGDGSTLRTFAIGRLVWWTTRVDSTPNDLATALAAPTLTKLAIAQPKTAPYGRAAQAVLQQLGVWDGMQGKIVVGESIAQTCQFIETGSADAGFVALSLVTSPKLRRRGHWIEVPPALHAAVPLDHAAIITSRGAANPAAHRYLAFLLSALAAEILRAHGYRIPAPSQPGN